MNSEDIKYYKCCIPIRLDFIMQMLTFKFQSKMDSWTKRYYCLNFRLNVLDETHSYQY